MGLQVGKLGSIFAGWMNAVRDLPQNPLPGRWAAADQHRTAARPWFKVNPGLLTIGIILSLVITAYIILLFLRMGQINQCFTAQIQARALLSMGSTALLMGAVVFTWCWLISAIYRFSEFCLRFLSLHQGRQHRPGLDDEIIITGLNPQEILAAAGLRMLQIMLPPLAIFSVSATLLLALLFHLTDGTIVCFLGPDSTLPNPGWWLTGCFLRLLIHGVVATLVMGYFMLSLGRTTQAFAPVFGAIGHTLLQAAWFTLSLLSLYHYGFNRRSALNDPLVTVCVGLLGVTTLVLLVFIIQRSHRLRRFQFLVPTGFIVLGLGVVAAMAFLENSSILYTFAGIRPEFAWTIHSLNIAWPLLVVPDQLVSGPGVAIDAEGIPYRFYEWWRMPVMAALQLLYLLILTEFARQVVRQRISGEGA